MCVKIFEKLILFGNSFPQYFQRGMCYTEGGMQFSNHFERKINNSTRAIKLYGFVNILKSQQMHKAQNFPFFTHKIMAMY